MTSAPASGLRLLHESLLQRYPSTQLTPISDEAAASLRSELPGLPTEYIRFLTEVGTGTIGRVSFRIYSRPIVPSDVFGSEHAARLEGVVLAADDYSGWHVGFDTRRNWALVTFDHIDLELDTYPGGFAQLLAEEFLA